MNIDENLTINIRIPWYMYKSQINYTQSKAAQELTITVITCSLYVYSGSCRPSYISTPKKVRTSHMKLTQQEVTSLDISPGVRTLPRGVGFVFIWSFLAEKSERFVILS